MWHWILFFIPHIAMISTGIAGEYFYAHLPLFDLFIIFYFYILTIHFCFYFFLQKEPAKKSKFLFFVSFRSICTYFALLCVLALYFVLDLLLYRVFVVDSLYLPLIFYSTIVIFSIQGVFLGIYGGVILGTFNATLAKGGKHFFWANIWALLAFFVVSFDSSKGEDTVSSLMLLMGICIFSNCILIASYYRQVRSALEKNERWSMAMNAYSLQAQLLFSRCRRTLGHEITMSDLTKSNDIYAATLEHRDYCYWVGILLNPSGVGEVYFQIYDLDYFSIPKTEINPGFVEIGYSDQILSPLGRCWVRSLGRIKINPKSASKLSHMIHQELAIITPWILQIRDIIISQLNSRSRLFAIRSFQIGYIHIDPWYRILQINSALGPFLGIKNFSREDYILKKISTLDLPYISSDLLHELLQQLEKGQKKASKVVEISKQGELQKIEVICSRSKEYREIVFQDISELEFRKEALQKVLPPTVTKQVLEDKGIDVKSGAYQDVSILFADLRGFTKVSDQITPKTLIRLLNTFFPPIIECAFKHQGTVNQIVGDEIMILFGAPQPQQAHTVKALNLAIEICQIHQQTIEKIRQENWFPKNIDIPKFGIGINSGEVVVGFLGSDKFTYYTAVGKHVNLAHRICDIAGGGEIFISQYAWEKAQQDASKNTLVFLEAGEKNFKGFVDPITIYKVR